MLGSSEFPHVRMARVGKDAWGYLLPARNEGCVFEVEYGRKAKSSFANRREELDVVPSLWTRTWRVVVRCKFGVEPSPHVVSRLWCVGSRRPS